MPGFYCILVPHLSCLGRLNYCAWSNHPIQRFRQAELLFIERLILGNDSLDYDLFPIHDIYSSLRRLAKEFAAVE